jgi:hypothetical protein
MGLGGKSSACKSMECTVCEMLHPHSFGIILTWMCSNLKMPFPSFND